MKPRPTRHGSRYGWMMLAMMVAVLWRVVPPEAALLDVKHTRAAVVDAWSGRPAEVRQPVDLLGTGTLQQIRIQGTAAEGWLTVHYTVVDGTTELGTFDLMTQTPVIPTVEVVGTGFPRALLVYQPIFSDPQGCFEVLATPGYWLYQFDGRRYQPRPLVTEPLNLWMHRLLHPGTLI